MKWLFHVEASGTPENTFLMLSRDHLDSMGSIEKHLRCNEADSEGKLLALKRGTTGRNQIRASDSNQYQFYCERHPLPLWKVPSCPPGASLCL